MKEWEELEEKFLNEIKPLVNQFIEYKNQKNPSILEKVDSVDIRKAVEKRAKEFIPIYEEMISKEIAIIEPEAESIKQQCIEIFKAIVNIKDNILKIDKAIEQTKDEDEYLRLFTSEIKGKQEIDKMSQERITKQKIYAPKMEQIGKLKEALLKYKDMSHITEIEMYNLDVIIGKKEESKMNRMSDGRVYYEDFDETKDFGDFIDIQEPAIEKEERDEQEAIKEKDKELQEIHKEIIRKVHASINEEFEEYWKQKMKEFDEQIDKEIQEEQIQAEELSNKNKKNKDNSKKGKISLWQRFKSIFRKRNVPFLEEGKEQGIKPKNKFIEGIQKGAPTREKQAEHTKWFFSKNKGKDDKTKEEKDIDGVPAILD